MSGGNDQEMDEEATKVLQQDDGGEMETNTSSESEPQRILRAEAAESTSIRNVGSSSTNVDHADTECGLTAQYIADGIRSMRRDQRVLAELIINKTLVYGLMNRLSTEDKFMPNGRTPAEARVMLNRAKILENRPCMTN